MLKKNHNYFKNIDTEGRAYFLGLLFADGSIESNFNSWVIRIGLQSQDKHILDSFKKELKYDGNLYESKNRFSLKISSKVLGDDLIKHGCIPKKSLILKRPSTVPYNLIWHFIRGVFDGDGSLTISGRGARFLIYGTKDLLDYIAEVIKLELNIHSTVIKTESIYMLSVSGNRQVTKLLEKLYNNANFYLIRKYNKKLELEELQKNIRPMRVREEAVDIQNIIKDYENGMKIKDIEMKHNISNAMFYRYFKKNKNFKLREPKKRKV